MNTQTTAAAAKKTTRKAAAASKYSDKPLEVDPPVTATEAAAPAPVDPARVPAGLKKAKAATKKASRAVVVKAPEAPTETEQMAAAVNDLQAKSAAAAKRAASKKAKLEAADFAPHVVKDANRHSAIAVASNGRTVELIPMDSAGMSVTKLSVDRFKHEYTAMEDYPVSKAAKVYLTQTIAMDPKAEAVLRALAEHEGDKPLASGTLVALMSKHDEAAAVAVPAANGEPAPKAPRAARTKAPKAERGEKPVASRAPAGELAKKIAAGDTKVEPKVQPGSFRAARHNYIVSMAGKTVAEVLGAATVEGKRGIAYRDITFAVSHGFIKLV